MKKNYFLPLTALFFLANGIKAQIATNYSVGTWGQFKTAAISYTFDDNCSNQLPVALPLFDKYGFKVTFFPVINFSPNWSALKTAGVNGHEVGSHTVTHTSLNTESVTTENTELQNSQSTINSNITNAKCVVLAYPNCNEGDLATIQKYYIAGRVCNGQVNPKTPNDFYQVGASITGNTGSLNSSTAFNNLANSAKSSGGWAVFLTHGIDSDGGYSPTPSSELATHLSYMNTNISNFWIATFGNVIKYIKERNAANISETMITSDSIKVTSTNNLDNTIYNVAISIRRVLPSGWKTPKVYIGGKLATSSLVTVSGTTYIQFDAVPGSSIFLSNPKTVITGLEEEIEMASVAIEPNPFWQETVLKAKGDFTYSITSLDGKQIENGMGTNTAMVGNQLPLGAYIVTIRQGNIVSTKKIIKN
jgi:oligosaccharide reducing-end xylanase